MISNFGFERKTCKSVPVEQVTFSSQDGFHFVTYHRGDETYGLIFDLGSFGAVAFKHGRNSIGIEARASQIEIARKRIAEI